MWTHVAAWMIAASFLLQGVFVPAQVAVRSRHQAQPRSSQPARPSNPAAHQLLPANYQLPRTTLPALCTSALQLENPAGCPKLGPGGYASQIVAAGLPYPFPALDIRAVPTYRGLTPAPYAKIITNTAPVYRHPYDALAGLPPLRRFETGYDYVSLLGQVSVDGHSYYQINRGEFMPAEDLQVVRPSSFQGRFFAVPPGGPVGWVLNNVQPSAAPGQPPDPNAPGVGRYQ